MSESMLGSFVAVDVVVLVVEEVSVVEGVVDVEVDVVSDVEVVSAVVAEVVPASVDVEPETVTVSVDPELDGAPESEGVPKAAAVRIPIANRATNAMVVQALLCGPPFFANGAI